MQALFINLVTYNMHGVLSLLRVTGDLLILPGGLVSFYTFHLYGDFVLGEMDRESGEYCSNLNEHYFLTDPEEFSFSHFPSIENGEDYTRWQLRENPISLEQFNSLPHLSPMFFELGLELVDDIPTPWVLQDGGILKIKAWEPIQYKVS